MKRPPERPTPVVPSGYLMVAGLLLLATPLSLLAWAAGSYALRTGARRWVLTLAGLVPGVAAAGLLGPGIARRGASALLGVGLVAQEPCVRLRRCWGPWRWDSCAGRS